MTAEAILIIIVIGAVAGWLAGLIVRGAGFGLIGDIIIGIVGAFVGSWVLGKLGVGAIVHNPLVDKIIVATIGAVILLLLIRLIRRA
jgi:uncharacterized membrane protein YeaQ/YmgE (transglycosylase-associated protein family)